MMRLINADSLKELYEGFGEYEDSLVVPIKIVLQNIDDMPTISMIVVDTWECPVCGTSFELDYENYGLCPCCGQAIVWRGVNE